MKLFLSVLIVCALASALAWATPSDPFSAKGTHHKVHRHHAHKAGKHRRPKRHRHAV